MKNEPQIPQSQALALERFAFITQIQDLLRQGFPLSVALEQVSLSQFRLRSERLDERVDRTAPVQADFVPGATITP